jgi:predicted acyltransferase (DUF342 family)
LRLEDFAQANCSVGGTGKVEVKKDALVSGDADSIEKEVRLDERATVGGDIDATQKVEIKDDATIGGSIIARNEIKIEHDVYVAGDAVSADKITVNTGSIIAGTQSQYNPSIPAAVPILLPEFEVIHGTSDFKVEKNTQVLLLPGNYKKLEVGENATLTLINGTYTFEEIVVKKDAIVELEAGAGSIVLAVKKKVEFDERAQMIQYSGAATDVLVLVAQGDVKLGKQGQYVGTFYAPNGHIDLEDEASLTGALYGEKVHVKKYASVTFAPAIDAYNDYFAP